MRRDLKRPGLPREKVLALAVKLLDATQVRVGNAEYARSNGSFGLTTLRDRHARFPPERRSERALRRCINDVVKDVAAGLRNTPAVCRKSYINPAVFIAWENGKLRRRAGSRRMR